MPDPVPAAAPTPPAPAATPPAPPPVPAASAAETAPSQPSLVNTTTDAVPPSQSLLTAEQPAPEDGKGTTPPAPVELDIKPPEGVPLDDKRFQSFKEFATASKLTQETAQKVLDMYGESLKEFATSQKNAWATQMAEWAKSAKDDPEFGQQNLGSSLIVARKAMDKYGTKGLREILDASGLGNHPELVRFMVRVGKSLAEDSVTGAVAGQPPNQVSDEDKLLRTLYPTMFPKDKE